MSPTYLSSCRSGARGALKVSHSTSASRSSLLTPSGYFSGMYAYFTQNITLNLPSNLPPLYVTCNKWYLFNASQFFTRFGRHYETPLLIQSILMNMAMFALVHLCVNINAREVIIKMEERVFTGMLPILFLYSHHCSGFLNLLCKGMLYAWYTSLSLSSHRSTNCTAVYW